MQSSLLCVCVEDLYTFGNLNFFPVCVCVRVRVCVCVWGGGYLSVAILAGIVRAKHTPSQ